MHVRGAIAVAVASIVTLASGRALAWQEVHQTGDDVEVRVEADGKASFRHALKWHVVRGPLKSIELLNVDPAAEIEGEVPVTSEEGKTFVAHAARVPQPDGGAVRIVVDEPRALMRGNFTFALVLHSDLVASRALAQGGGMWRLAWSSPVATEGFDAARTTLVLPAAPEAPRPIVPDTGAFDDSVVATLHRQPSEDVLELVRPHVARGEAVAWTVRVDPRAFPRIVDPRLRPAPPPRTQAEPGRFRHGVLLTALAALGLLYGWAVRRRRADGLLDGLRAVLAGIAAAAAVGLELAGEYTLGAVCVSVAVLAASVRVPDPKAPARGPGRWLVLRPDEAFAGEAGRLSRAARALALAALGLIVAMATLVGARSQPVWLAALDAAMLVPLLLPPGGEPFVQASARMASRWLKRVFRKLSSGAGEAGGLRVAPWARVVGDDGRCAALGTCFDELRLLVMPRVAMPGVLGVEVGLAWASTPAGWVPSPEVLARVLEESPAAARLAIELPGARSTPGRRPQERVVRMLPRAPTADCTAALVRELADRLTDRRAAIPSLRYLAEERRGRGREAADAAA
jgi:hypothetical protein